MTEKNLATTQNVVRYKQSWNLWTKNWGYPKREDGDGEWKHVSYKHLAPVVTKSQGLAFALWRIRKVMEGVKDEHGRTVWKVNNISKRDGVWKGIRYSVYQFDCHRIAHGIIGGMNTAGGANG